MERQCGKERMIIEGGREGGREGAGVSKREEGRQAGRQWKTEGGKKGKRERVCVCVDVWTLMWKWMRTCRWNQFIFIEKQA